MRAIGISKEHRHYRLSFFDELEKIGTYSSKHTKICNGETMASDMCPTEEDFY